MVLPGLGASFGMVNLPQILPNGTFVVPPYNIMVVEIWGAAAGGNGTGATSGAAGGFTQFDIVITGSGTFLMQANGGAGAGGVTGGDVNTASNSSGTGNGASAPGNGGTGGGAAQNGGTPGGGGGSAIGISTGGGSSGGYSKKTFIFGAPGSPLVGDHGSSIPGSGGAGGTGAGNGGDGRVQVTIG